MEDNKPSKNKLVASFSNDTPFAEGHGDSAHYQGSHQFLPVAIPVDEDFAREAEFMRSLARERIKIVRYEPSFLDPMRSDNPLLKIEALDEIDHAFIALPERQKPRPTWNQRRNQSKIAKHELIENMLKARRHKKAKA